MKTLSGKSWAYFFQRLGLPITASDLKPFIDSLDDYEVWALFIASDKLYYDAAQANKIYGPVDVCSFLRDASYAGMRSTFPAKSHGRRVIGPQLIPVQKLIVDGVIDIPENQKHYFGLSTLAKAPIKYSDLYKKRIVHFEYDGEIYGAGIIEGIDGDEITVRFDSVGLKRISYSKYIEMGYITIF